MTAIRLAQAYLFQGPGARLIALGLIATISTAAWCVGYLATLELSPFRLAVIVLLLSGLPIVMVHAEILPPLFLGILWARVSDIAISVHGVPSIATPFAGFLLILSLVKKIIAGEKITLRTFSDVALAVPYVLVVSLSALWSTFPARALSNANILIKDIVIFWMFADAFRDRRVLLRGAEILVASASLLSLPSLHQYITGNFASQYGGFAQSAVLNIVGDFESYRLGGPLSSPNYFALILLVTVPVGIALLKTSLPVLERLTIFSLLVPIVLTVFLTFSRGGSVLLVFLIFVALRRFKLGPAQLMLGVILLGSVIMFMPPRVWDRLGTLAGPLTGQSEERTVVDESVDLRIGAQRTAIEMFVSHPFFGVGSGNFPPLYQEYSRWLGIKSLSSEYTPHNLYLELLAETGVVGLGTFLLTAIIPLLALRRSMRRFPTETREGRDHLELSYGLELALVGWLIAGFFEQGAFPRYYWMLLAMVIGASHAGGWCDRTATMSPARESAQPVHTSGSRE